MGRITNEELEITDWSMTEEKVRVDDHNLQVLSLKQLEAYTVDCPVGIRSYGVILVIIFVGCLWNGHQCYNKCMITMCTLDFCLTKAAWVVTQRCFRLWCTCFCTIAPPPTRGDLHINFFIIQWLFDIS